MRLFVFLFVPSAGFLRDGSLPLLFLWSPLEPLLLRLYVGGCGGITTGAVLPPLSFPPPSLGAAANDSPWQRERESERVWEELDES